MKVRCYFDTHIGGPLEIFKSEVISEPPKKHLYLGGDIVELRNSPFEDLASNYALYHSLKAIHGENYIDGNHDSVELKNQFVIGTSDDTGLRFGIFHSDIETNPDRYWDQRRDKHGASKFKRKFIVPAIEWAEQFRSDKLKDDFIERVLEQMVTHDLDYFIGGHKHPPKMLKKAIDHRNKVRKIIICPRGCTDLDL